MNKEQNTLQTTQPAIAVDTVLGRVFVVNYDEAIIFNTNKDLHFYDETYHTFEQAKEQLVSYWDNAVSEAKRKLKEVKMYKLGNVQSIP